jgi:sugar O-acyltransferase (sialic acid O-acetyltransferase NeuD family)
MRRRLLIFGLGSSAELALYYFKSDSQYEVVAFTVDEPYLSVSEFCGLPVVSFRSIVDSFPTTCHDLFVAVGYSNLNAVRKQKYLEGKALGYRLATYISSRATVLNAGNFGDNCFILEDNTIQPFVTIGNNVTLWSGNHIGHHTVIKDHTFVASHVVVSGGVEIGEQCFIGVNATIRDAIKIGNRCVIGAGAILLKDADDDGLYVSSGTVRSKVPSSRLRNI